MKLRSVLPMLLCLMVFSSAGRAADVTGGLVARYLCDGDASDDQGGNDATVEGGASFTADRFGNPSSACEFFGVDSWISLPSLIPSDADWEDGFSVTWWQRADFTSGFRMVWRLEEEKGIQAFYDEVAFGTGFCVALLFDGRWTSVCDAAPSTDWVHYAFVFDGFNMNLYKSGEVLALDTIPGIDDRSFINAFGGRGMAFEFDGAMDDFRVYNRPLLGNEVNKIQKSKE